MLPYPALSSKYACAIYSQFAGGDIKLLTGCVFAFEEPLFSAISPERVLCRPSVLYPRQRNSFPLWCVRGSRQCAVNGTELLRARKETASCTPDGTGLLGAGPGALSCTTSRKELLSAHVDASSCIPDRKHLPRVRKAAPPRAPSRMLLPSVHGETPSRAVHRTHLLTVREQAGSCTLDRMHLPTVHRETVSRTPDGTHLLTVREYICPPAQAAERNCRWCTTMRSHAHRREPCRVRVWKKDPGKLLPSGVPC